MRVSQKSVPIQEEQSINPQGKLLKFIFNLNQFLARHRIHIVTVTIICLLIEDILESIRPHDISSIRDVWGMAGAVLVLAGALFRSWAAGIIKKNRELASQGPYAFSRHPLYLGSLLMFIGFAMIIGDQENIWIVFLIFSFLYVPAILKEERKLKVRFNGEWINYTKRTAMFFPKKLSGNIFSSWSIEQWIKNREYVTFATALILLWILQLIHDTLLFRGI